MASEKQKANPSGEMPVSGKKYSVIDEDGSVEGDDSLRWFIAPFLF